jgi:hypothetical protein
MSNDNNKAIWLALAGVGALVGAALVYHYASEGQGGEISDSDIKIALEEQKIGEPQEQANGLLENRYFLNLLQFIGV